MNKKILYLLTALYIAAAVLSLIYLNAFWTMFINWVYIFGLFIILSFENMKLKRWVEKGISIINLLLDDETGEARDKLVKIIDEEDGEDEKD